MGNEYTRQSSSAIVDGSTIQAEDLNSEFNALENAFSEVSALSSSIADALKDSSEVNSQVYATFPTIGGESASS